LHIVDTTWDAAYQPGTVKERKRLLDAYLQYCTRSKKDWKEVETAFSFLNALFVIGYSHSYGSKARDAINVHRASLNLQQLPYLGTFKAWKKLTKKRKVEKVPLSEADLWSIVDAEACPNEFFGWVCILSFALLLRRGEVGSIQPGSITKCTMQGVEYYTVCIQSPKTNKGGVQNAYLPASAFSERLRTELTKFNKLPGQIEWIRILGSWDRFNKEIRKCFPSKPISHHCLRHGRATELFHKYGLSLEQLKRAGRWATDTSVATYVHTVKNTSQMRL